MIQDTGVETVKGISDGTAYMPVTVGKISRKKMRSERVRKLRVTYDKDSFLMPLRASRTLR